MLSPHTIIMKPLCLQPVLCNKRKHWNQKPAHHNEEQFPLATTRLFFKTKFGLDLPLSFAIINFVLLAFSCCYLSAKLYQTLLWSHGLQPTRLLCLWDSPDKNTEWVVMSSSSEFSRLSDWTRVSCISFTGQFFVFLFFFFNH